MTQETGDGKQQAEAAGRGPVVREADSEECSGGKLLSSERRRGAAEHARRKYGVSERYACRVVQQRRGTKRYLPMQRTDEDALTEAITALASEYGRYGFRRALRVGHGRFVSLV